MLVIFTCISIVTVTLSPEQIQSFADVLGAEPNKEFANEMIELTDSLSKENASLKEDIRRLTESASLSETEKDEIVSKPKKSENDLREAYNSVIEKQLERTERISLAIPTSNQQQQTVLTIEEARLRQQIGQLQQQQQQQR